MNKTKLTEAQITAIENVEKDARLQKIESNSVIDHILNMSDMVSENNVKDGMKTPIPIKQPRKDWDKEFKRMHKNAEDVLLIDDTVNDESEDWV
jgi:hypothetical protein